MVFLECLEGGKKLVEKEKESICLKVIEISIYFTHGYPLNYPLRTHGGF
jgi:hypothetical protein